MALMRNRLKGYSMAKVINMKQWQIEKNVNKLDRLCRDSQALLDEVNEGIKYLGPSEIKDMADWIVAKMDKEKGYWQNSPTRKRTFEW